MPDLKKYWQEVRAIEKTLPEFVWVMSLENASRGQTGGSLSEVSAPVAAKLLHSQSHRLATEEEIGRYHEQQLTDRNRIRQEHFRKRGIAIVPWN